MNIVWDFQQEEKLLNLWTDFKSFYEKKNKNFDTWVFEESKVFASERESMALKMLKQFPLSTDAGLALMTLCECYPRITNIKLRQKLLANTLKKLPGLLSGTASLLKLGAAKKAEELIAKQVIDALSSSFVVVTDLKDLNVASEIKNYGGLSIDCLGEAAQTNKEVKNYLTRYQEALKYCDAYNKESSFSSDLTLSVKLSALSTDFSVFSGCAEVEENLDKLITDLPHLKTAIALDAEEVHRSQIQRDVFLKIIKNNSNKCLSLAQQAYLVNGLENLCSLLAQGKDNYFGIRVVKGAYYDYEIREAQKGRYTSPVWSKKELTDISWALMSLTMGYSAKYAQFATHSPQSLAQLIVFQKSDQLWGQEFRGFVKNLFIKYGLLTKDSALFTEEFLSGSGEVQYLYGMGGLRQKSCAEKLTNKDKVIRYRAYAPVGGQKELLPYLVRRLIENGVNNSVWQSSNVKNITHENISKINFLQKIKNKLLRFKSDQKLSSLKSAVQNNYQGHCDNIVFAKASGVKWWENEFTNKWNHQNQISLKNAPVKSINQVQEEKGCKWINLEKRSIALNSILNYLNTNKDQLIHVLVHEAKKHPVDALGEWQEAVDFISFYSSTIQSGINSFKDSNNTGFTFLEELKNVIGERNWRYKVGVKSILCISPWNFPLAITIGQLGAAICAGVENIYLKPSPKINHVYYYVEKAFSQLDGFNFSLVDGSIEEFESKLTNFDVVLFTGGTTSFKAIKGSMKHEFTKLIGETGGINALVADGSIEPGSIADIIVKSSFYYSGQKCSSVRVVFIDESLFDEVVEKIQNYGINWGQEFNSFGRDVIDSSSIEMKNRFVEKLKKSNGVIIHNGQGALAIMDLDKVVWEECFAPVIQLVKVQVEDQWHNIKKQIKDSKSALTFTLLSKDQEKIQDIFLDPLAGNQYINRVSTGAVVGAQPFGGFKNSGTGPKIGTVALVDALCVDIVGTFETSLFGGTVGVFDNGRETLLINPISKLHDN